MTTDLATRDESALSPEVFGRQITWAHEKARLLKTIVDSQKLSVKVGPSEHLRLEAWQTIGKGYGYSASTEVQELLRDDGGNIIGVQARASIIDMATGIIVGGADSYCFAAEEGKGQQTIAQLAGMAQTRAEARAFKQMLSWVVVLAGYDATPAEEMVGALARERTARGSRGANGDGGSEPSNFCPLHRVDWFKRGQMKAWGHPVEGETNAKTGKNVWCMKADILAKTTPSKSLQDDQEGGSEPPWVVDVVPTPQKASFANLGELMDRINKTYHLTTNQVLDILELGHMGQLNEKFPDKAVAWERIVASQQGKG